MWTPSKLRDSPVAIMTKNTESQRPLVLTKPAIDRFPSRTFDGSAMDVAAASYVVDGQKWKSILSTAGAFSTVSIHRLLAEPYPAASKSTTVPQRMAGVISTHLFMLVRSLLRREVRPHLSPLLSTGRALAPPLYWRVLTTLGTFTLTHVARAKSLVAFRTAHSYIIA